MRWRHYEQDMKHVLAHEQAHMLRREGNQVHMLSVSPVWEHKEWKEA